MAVEKLANTNKELKPIGDVEYDLRMAMVSMVNGTLMAKGEGRRVSERPRPRYLLRTDGPRGRSARLALPYFDLNVLGVKCGPIRLGNSARARRRDESNMSRARGKRALLTVQPLELGV